MAAFQYLEPQDHCRFINEFGTVSLRDLLAWRERIGGLRPAVRIGAPGQWAPVAVPSKSSAVYERT